MPSTTDRVKYINRYIGPVKLIPIDIQEDSFEIKGGKFDPSKLELDNAENHKMREAVLKVLRKGVDLSNSNLVKNADGLLATRPTNKIFNGWAKLENVSTKIYIRCLIIFSVAYSRQ